jgi:hypothetical protein
MKRTAGNFFREQYFIGVELPKAAKEADSSEGKGSLSKNSNAENPPFQAISEADPGRIRHLEKEVLELKITNRGKDYFIEQLQREREGFAAERQGYVGKLMEFNRKVAELQTKLLQLEEPKAHEGNADKVSHPLQTGNKD